VSGTSVHQLIFSVTECAAPTLECADNSYSMRMRNTTGDQPVSERRSTWRNLRGAGRPRNAARADQGMLVPDTFFLKLTGINNHRLLAYFGFGFKFRLIALQAQRRNSEFIRGVMYSQDLQVSQLKHPRRSLNAATTGSKSFFPKFAHSL
jgi:hypothetical protein